MRAHLSAEYGISVSTGRVYRLMKIMNLPKMSTIKAKPNNLYAKVDDSINLHNYLKQNFNQPAPNLVWCGDISYINIGKNRHVYLCIVMDLFSRKIVAHSVSNKHNAQLVIDTFLMAYYARNCPVGLMFHSDQGSEYTSSSFRKLLDSLGVTQSFSAKGHPYDNAVVECFFKYIKKEELDRRNFQTLEEVRLTSFDYIEGYYNSRRFHSHNNNETPNKKESAYYAKAVDSVL